MLDVVYCAHAIEGVPSARSRLSPPTSFAEAISELRAVVSEDSVHLVRKSSEEPLKTERNRPGIAARDDLDVYEARGAVDGDEHKGRTAFEARQVLQVDMDEADRRRLEHAGRLAVFLRLGPLRDPVAPEATVDAAARQLGIGAAAHDLDDVVERQSKRGPQFDRQRLLGGRHRYGKALGRVRAVGDAIAIFPAADGGFVDAILGREHSYRSGLGAQLNFGPGARRGAGVRVQLHVHRPRRSLTKAMPLATPIPSRQSPGTKHEGGHPRERTRL